jgi:hypothetical protein
MMNEPYYFIYINIYTYLHIYLHYIYILYIYIYIIYIHNIYVYIHINTLHFGRLIYLQDPLWSSVFSRSTAPFPGVLRIVEALWDKDPPEASLKC